MIITFRNNNGTKEYNISHWNDPKDPCLWLSNEASEGMTIRFETMFEILDEYFKKNF